jgi:hypothetical protein
MNETKAPKAHRLRDELHENAIERVRGFFVALEASRDRLSLGAIKTCMGRRLRGDPTQAHE